MKHCFWRCFFVHCQERDPKNLERSFQDVALKILKWKHGLFISLQIHILLVILSKRSKQTIMLCWTEISVKSLCFWWSQTHGFGRNGMNSCLQVVKPSFQRKKSSGCLLVNLNVSWQTDNLPLKNAAPQTKILQKPSKLMLRLKLHFFGGMGGHNLFLKQNECHNLNLFWNGRNATRSLPVNGAQIIHRPAWQRQCCLYGCGAATLFLGHVAPLRAQVGSTCWAL